MIRFSPRLFVAAFVAYFVHRRRLAVVAAALRTLLLLGAVLATMMLFFSSRRSSSSPSLSHANTAVALSVLIDTAVKSTDKTPISSICAKLSDRKNMFSDPALSDLKKNPGNCSSYIPPAVEVVIQSLLSLQMQKHKLSHIGRSSDPLRIALVGDVGIATPLYILFSTNAQISSVDMPTEHLQRILYLLAATPKRVEDAPTRWSSAPDVAHYMPTIRKQNHLDPLPSVKDLIHSSKTESDKPSSFKSASPGIDFSVDLVIANVTLLCHRPTSDVDDFIHRLIYGGGIAFIVGSPCAKTSTPNVFMFPSISSAVATQKFYVQPVTIPASKPDKSDQNSVGQIWIESLR